MPGATARGAARRLLFVAANPSIDRLYEVDRLVAGVIHRPRSIVAVPGGKGLNAARAALALGGSLTAVGIAGGRAGDWILERLAELGIDARMAGALGETRTCVSILDISSGALTEIYERGAETEPASWADLEAIVEAELARGDIAAVALSGSLPPGAPPDGYARITRIARTVAGVAHPVWVIADTYGPVLAAVLAERPSIVKVNTVEAGEATGVTVADAASAAAAADALREAGAGSVIVTLGLQGAIVVSSNDRAHLVPPDIRGAYGVGSGDAFLGGLVVALERGEPIVEAARFGLAAGIANAQIPGAGTLDTTMIEPILKGISAISLSS
jgi:1-phosphofructokinase family hexose kinase